jgi:hypothetical protein
VQAVPDGQLVDIPVPPSSRLDDGVTQQGSASELRFVEAGRPMTPGRNAQVEVER